MKRLETKRCTWMAAILTTMLFGPSAAAADDSEAELKAKPDTIEDPHQLAVGLGLPVLMHMEHETLFGGSEEETAYVGDEFLWISAPIRYRYRVNRWFAAGGGIVFNKLVNSERGEFGVEARPGVRVYPLPDWLYIDFDLMIGYPYLWALVPGIGVQIPVTERFNVYLHNEVPITIFNGGVGLMWRPLVGVEPKF